MIRVCLVEDQTLVRQGIQTLLELVDDIVVVAEAKDGDEALRVIPQSRPDVVLLDMYLPKRNGLEVLRELKRSEFLPPTLILTLPSSLLGSAYTATASTSPSIPKWLRIPITRRASA